MPMMNKTVENMQQLGKEWSAYSRRVSRDALRAMSGQLEIAARYLGDLSHRLDESPANGAASEAEPNGHAPKASAETAETESRPSEHVN